MPDPHVFLGQTIPELLNICGLALDIIGVGLVWKYGLPEMLPGSGSVLLTEGKPEKEKRKEAQYQFWSKVGLSLIILGFALQAASTFLA